MRARTCSALSPASTANGSIGACRKRDFFFMREQLNHRSEGLSDAEVERRAIAERAAAIVAERDACGEGQRREVRDDDVRRGLDADRGLEVACLKRRRPRLSGVCE